MLKTADACGYVDKLSARSRSPRSTTNPFLSGDSAHSTGGQGRYPQAPVDELLGDVGDRAHGSAMPSDRISREPVPLAECVAEVLAILLELDLPETEISR